MKLADLINDVQIDLNNKQFQRNEVPLVANDTTALRYYVKYFPLGGNQLNKDVFVYVDGVQLNSGVSIQQDRGYISLTVAPVSSIQTDYYFSVFSEPEIISFITAGFQNCGSQTIDSLDDGFTPAVKKFALHYGYIALSRKYAEGFSWSFGQETVNKDTLSAKYLALAGSAWNEAVVMRDDFYKRFGARNAPAWGVGTIPLKNYDVRR